MLMSENSLIDFKNFVVVTRDSGYKTTASALAELIDNAIEANASIVDIEIKKNVENSVRDYEVIIVDNGLGMTKDELDLSLQFGGTTRFNSRNNFGRYGMGLPNSSLSQCRRVEVISWKNKSEIFKNYLDIDEIIENNQSYANTSQGISSIDYSVTTKSGTIVTWKKCDRLSFKYSKNLLKHIKFELARIFRYALWRGVQIRIENQSIIAFDPMFLRKGLNLVGAKPFGQEINYEVRIPGNEQKTSTVKVRFVELPIKNWAMLSNDEKRRNQITKSAGVSVLRSEREIDYGWFFFGDKRKENYDDWWRCEILFTPELDELFGVTHTKQEIKQTEFLNKIIVSDLEQIARELNKRVRLKFIELKKNHPSSYAKTQLERTDIYQPELKYLRKSPKNNIVISDIKGFKYEILSQALTDNIFFDIERIDDNMVLIINTNHLFHERIFRALHDKKIKSVAEFIKVMELVMFAAARSELSFNSSKEVEVISNFKREWSAQLKTFIS